MLLWKCHLYVITLQQHIRRSDNPIAPSAAGSGASTTGCTMPCAGAADEQCGNGYKSSLYTSVSSVVKPLGCYVDSNPRILPDYSFKSASMTPLLCQSTCMSKGYSFAG